ncbi:hypothetical protein Tco_1174493 [Tanacetum coccineum]
MPNKHKELVNKPNSTSLTLSRVEHKLEVGDEVHGVVHDNLVRDNSKYKQDADQKRRQYLLPYYGDSSDDDLLVNSRPNFVYTGGMMQAQVLKNRLFCFCPGLADSKLGMRRTPWYRNFKP